MNLGRLGARGIDSSLPPPDEIAAEIVVSLEEALEKVRSVAAKLGAQPAE